MCGPVSWTESGSAPRAAASPAGAVAGVSGAVGKSRVIAPSGWVVAVRIPQRAAKRTVPLAVPVVCRTCAVARVACPHMSTSVVGVNQRSAQSASPPGGSGWAKAVSDRFSSMAIRWSRSSPAKVSESSTRTPAGLPEKGRSVNVSTMRILMP